MGLYGLYEVGLASAEHVAVAMQAARLFKKKSTSVDLIVESLPIGYLGICSLFGFGLVG